MSTNNPFAHHTNNLFASRGCDIDQAMSYAQDMITALPSEMHAHATTALMVVVNTAANAWAQSQGSGPAQAPAQEIATAWVRELVAQEFEKNLAKFPVMVSELVDTALTNTLDDKVDSWMHNSIDFDDYVGNLVESWVENNLDVGGQVNDWLDDNLGEKISDTINDLDLVVRVR